MVIDYTVTHEEHETLAPFLTAANFTENNDNGLTLYKFPLSKIVNSPLFAASANDSSKLLCFNKIDDTLLLTAQKAASVQEVPLPEASLTSTKLDRELSHAFIKDGEIKAFVTFDHSCADLLTLSCAWVDTANPGILAILLRKALQRANELYSPDTMIAVQAVTESSEKLIQTLVPDAERFSFTYSASIY